MPKLIEMYESLFGEKFSDAHDASFDVNATAKSFFKLAELGEYKNDDISKENIQYEEPKLGNSNFDKKIKKTEVTVEKNKNDIKSEFIHLHKTGALLKACVICGALIAGAEEDLLEALKIYAKGIGLAFQIIDDILDVTASSEVLGKTAGKDLISDKTTYPKLLGLEESRRRADALVKEAKEALIPWEKSSAPLMALADFITKRDR